MAPKSSKGKEPEKSPLLKRPSTSKEPEVDVCEYYYS